MPFGLIVVLIATVLVGCESDSSPATDDENAVVAELRQAEIDTARVDIERLQNALDMYRVMHDRYPETLRDLVTEEIVSSDERLVDPWDSRYVLEVDSAGEAVIYSLGPDGAPDSGDEVRRR